MVSYGVPGFANQADKNSKKTTLIITIIMLK